MSREPVDGIDQGGREAAATWPRPSEPGYLRSNSGSGKESSNCQLRVPTGNVTTSAEPDFVLYDANDLPVLDGEGKVIRVIAGSVLGASSPVTTSSAMFYADVSLNARASVPLDPDYQERAIYTVAGDVEIAGDVFGPAQLLVFRPGDRITIRARTNARFMALGGEPMDGPRHIWWNFVSSRKDRIAQAKADWKMARFDLVPGDTEFIPLPEPEPEAVRYP